MGQRVLVVDDDLEKSLGALARDLGGDEEDDLFKSLSFEDTRELVRVAVQEKYRPKKQDKMKLYYGPWVREMFPDCVIISMEGKGEHFKLGYSIVDGKATLGEPVQVKQSWEPIAKSKAAEEGIDVLEGDDTLQKSEPLNPLTEPNGPTGSGYTLDFHLPEEFPSLMAPMTMESPDIVDGIDNRRTFVPNISALRPAVVEE